MRHRERRVDSTSLPYSSTSKSSVRAGIAVRPLAASALFYGLQALQYIQGASAVCKCATAFR